MANLGGKFIGDPLERSAFEAMKWNIDQNNGNISSARTSINIKTFKKFLFDSTLKRMSTIVQAKKSGGRAYSNHLVLTKGAPEVV